MKKYMKLIIAMILCILWASCAQAQDPNDPNNPEEAAVKIVLTKFDVNDTTLELGWKITNNTDHDVWICDSASVRFPPGFDVLLDRDAKTLLVRRLSCIDDKIQLRERFGVSCQYVRLLPGQEKIDSVCFDVPVRQEPIFDYVRTSAEYAKRVVMEIGFYDEDLPGLILRIAEVNEKLNCDLSMGSVQLNGEGILDRFFPGRQIAQVFNRSIGLKESVMSAVDEVVIPHMGENLNGEKILRIEIDGLSIPLTESTIRPSSHIVKGALISKEQIQQTNSPDRNDAKTDKG